MRCVAIRHIECEDLGTFDEPLRERFAHVAYVDMEGTREPPGRLQALLEAELVVTLGGPMAVYEADRYPFLAREIELLGERLAAGRPTLGICLGAQLMAAAAGARVFPGGRQEIGWYPIRWAPHVAADPVLGRLAEGSDVVFHWHGDTFDLPAGARPIGSSERFAHQGFMLGRHGVALQFHAEVDEVVLGAWLDRYESQLPAGEGIMTAAELRAGASEYGPSLRRRGRAFLEAWLDEVLPRA